MSSALLVDHLRDTPAFAGAPEAALAELANAFVERPFSAGETIVNQGDTGGEFFFLAEGELSVTVPRGADRAEPTGTIGAGDTFGEIASLTGGKRMATVTARAAGRLLVLPGTTFQDVLHRHPAMAETVLRSLARYLEN